MQAAAADGSPQRAALDNAKLALQQAQYAYGVAQANLQGQQQVVAQLTGTVSALDAAVGQSLGAGAPVAAIVETAGLLATVDVPQAQPPRIAPGESALLLLDGTNYPGQVQSVGPAPDSTYRGVPSYPVTIALANPGGLLPGMPVIAAIEASAQAQTWTTGLSGTLARGGRVGHHPGGGHAFGPGRAGGPAGAPVRCWVRSAPRPCRTPWTRPCKTSARRRGPWPRCGPTRRRPAWPCPTTCSKSRSRSATCRTHSPATTPWKPG